jgi:hypothetical protein
MLLLSKIAYSLGDQEINYVMKEERKDPFFFRNLFLLSNNSLFLTLMRMR